MTSIAEREQVFRSAIRRVMIQVRHGENHFPAGPPRVLAVILHSIGRDDPPVEGDGGHDWSSWGAGILIWHLNSPIFSFSNSSQSRIVRICTARLYSPRLFTCGPQYFAPMPVSLTTT